MSPAGYRQPKQIKSQKALVCVTAHCMCLMFKQPLLLREAGLEEAGETTRRAESAVICDVSVVLPARPISLDA